jgi:hypothetical protein
MSKPLSKQQATAVECWTAVMNRAHPADRRYLSIMATGDVGHREVVRCVSHPPEFSVTRPMTFSEAYRHVEDTDKVCELVADLSRVEVAS